MLVNFKIAKTELEDLYINHNLTRKEIATIYNCSVSTIKIYLHAYKIVKHQNDVLKTIKACKNCGKEYLASHRRKYFCSATCKTEYSRTHKKLVKKVCPVCGKVFYTNRKIWSNCCSKQCRSILRKNASIKAYSDHPDLKDKIAQTNMRRYGVTCTLNDPVIRKKATTNSIKTLNKPEVQQKIYESKVKNKTISTSQFEEKCNTLLCTKYSVVLRNYKSVQYPFACDFYLPEIDTYIEIQGHASHGKEPYNSNNIKHQLKVNLWKQKALEINFKGDYKKSYLDYIDVWTRRDPLKRKVAKENKLNWLEFFTMDQFMDWYNKQ